MTILTIVTVVPRVPMALNIDREASRWDKHSGNNTKTVIATRTAAGDWNSDPWLLVSTAYRQRGVQVDAMMIEKDQHPNMALPKIIISTNN